MIYVYAITDRPQAALPHQSGLQGAPLINVEYEGIAAVASSLPTASVRAVEHHLWQHETVVEALMAHRTALPVRFGTMLASEAAVRATLKAGYTSFVADLARVRGQVELGLRVLWDHEGELLSTPADYAAEKASGERIMGEGWLYMLHRLEEDRCIQEQRRRAESLAADIHTPLARMVTDSTQQVLSSSRMLLTAAYLVEREKLLAFQQQVKVLQRAHPELDFMCTGPWPAYSFVTASMKMVPGE